MRLLADENFPLPSVRILRQAGHDVAAVVEDMPGAIDRVVLARAVEERCILLTFDRDHSALVYRHGLPAPEGVIYFRVVPRSPDEPAEQLLRLVATPGLTLEGRLTVVEPGQVRQRILP